MDRISEAQWEYEELFRFSSDQAEDDYNTERNRYERDRREYYWNHSDSNIDQWAYKEGQLRAFLNAHHAGFDAADAFYKNVVQLVEKRVESDMVEWEDAYGRMIQSQNAFESLHEDRS